MIITEKPDGNLFSYVTIKIKSSSVSSTLSLIKSEWEKLNPATVFKYLFLDNEINQLYNPESNFRKLFFVFALLAVLLALLGLFSLSSLSAEQKTKEIGIRKVLGDTTFGITIRILNEYVLLVVLADIIGCFAAYYFMDNWLNNFAYHINQSSIIFILTAAITLLFGISVVIYNAVKVANSNPGDALRYE